LPNGTLLVKFVVGSNALRKRQDMSGETADLGYKAGEAPEAPIPPADFPDAPATTITKTPAQNRPARDGTFRKDGTVRREGTLLPPKKLPNDSRYNMLLMERQRTLGSKDIADQVKLPPGASVEEWLAVTTIDFFNELNLLIGAMQDLCTEQTCPEMKAGQFSWLWADGEKIKDPIKLSAPAYFEHLLTWVDAKLSDESFLPVEPGAPFPPTYKKGMRVIYKRLFRIYAHIFHSHFKEIMEDEADAHLNHSFKHFIYFVKEFDLMETEEMEPMKDLVLLFMEQRARGEHS
jgi:MOB kinase activator 1